MHQLLSQAPSAVVMVRPRNFHVNPETGADNAFQATTEVRPCPELAKAVAVEVEDLAERLESLGVRTHVFDEPRSECPDAVFPNNWFSTHPTGQIVLYPMCSVSRRRERRTDIVDHLKHHYQVDVVVDYSGWEIDGVFLEGTGAMVIDHIGRNSYLCLSRRANGRLFGKVCSMLDLEPFAFEAYDNFDRAIYHTNVMMCLGGEFCLVGADLVRDVAMRAELYRRLERSGREIVELSAEQISAFAANAIELSASERKVLVMSISGFGTLSGRQRGRIEQYAEIVPVAVPAVQLAGGSVRCMLAGVHLEPRQTELPPSPNERGNWL